MAEPPLTDRELVMVRGMIDDHEHRLERNRVLRDFWTTGRIIVISAAAVVAWLLTVIASVLSIQHG